MAASNLPSNSSSANSHGRLIFLVVCAILLFCTIYWYAQEQWIIVLDTAFREGLAAAGWIFSATMLGFAVLRILRTEADGLFAFVTAAAIGLGALSLALCGLSLMGVLSHGLVIGIAAASVVAGILSFAIRTNSHECPSIRKVILQWMSSASSWQWLWLPVVPLLGISVVGACLLPGSLWRPNDPHPYDVLVYHLQVPREWYEAGRMFPLLHNVYSFFPFNTEMHFLAGMYLRGGPWAGMYAAQFMSLGFTVLAVLGIYSGARIISGQTDFRAASLAAMATSAVPWIVMVSCVAYVESLLVLYATLTIVWALRSMESKSPMRSMAMAGMMAGFAAGVKLPAVPMLLLALPAAICVVNVRNQGQFRQVIARCAVFVLTGLLVLSPWLIRNAVWIGNPLFPLAMNTLGHAHFTPEQVQRFNQAHVAKPNEASLAGRFSMFGSEVLYGWQYGFVFWPLVVIAMIDQYRRRQTWICALTLLMMAICWIFFTHLVGRFLVIGIPVASLLISQARSKASLTIGAVVACLCAVMSLIHINFAFERWAANGREGVFGIQDIGPLLPELLERIEKQSNGVVVMVGDSEAFLHQIPMSRLRYRTMFDLNTTNLNPSDWSQIVNAWAGESVDSLPPGSAILVNPTELQRLSETYYRVPNLPAPVPGPRDRPFVIELPPKP
ncbi:MAG TPA: hypothetical protein VHD56_10355 [Tepidisphaeraceae bacterium]|nr:hypothetical protein [Tepidisphaeraceae bacterium]